jgi:hypothetical protein
MLLLMENASESVSMHRHVIIENEASARRS